MDSFDAAFVAAERGGGPAVPRRKPAPPAASAAAPPPLAAAAAIDAADFSDLDIKPAYIDGNGHMNVGYYSVLFDRALERFLRPLEVGWDFMQSTGKTGFVLEHHTRYMREVKMGDPLAFTFELVDWDAKRMHHLMTMRHATEGWTASVQEAIAICVDVATRTVACRDVVIGY